MCLWSGAVTYHATTQKSSPQHTAAAQEKAIARRTYPDRGDPHADDNGLLGESGEVRGQTEVTAVVTQQDAVAHGTQSLNPLDERLFLNATVPAGPVKQIPTLQRTPFPVRLRA